MLGSRVRAPGGAQKGEDCINPRLFWFVRHEHTLTGASPQTGSPGKRITGKTLCEQNLLSIYLTKSEKEILYIHNPSNLSSESLYLCVKRFCGSISGAVVKEVQDIFVVIVYCFLYCTECVNSRFRITCKSMCFGIKSDQSQKYVSKHRSLQV